MDEAVIYIFCGWWWKRKYRNLSASAVKSAAFGRDAVGVWG
jgi:hypothetical protein